MKKSQQYTAEEFDAIARMVTDDRAVRALVEATTGQSVDGKTPRQVFDLYRQTKLQAALTEDLLESLTRARRPR